MDERDYDPTDDDLSLIRRELIRVANRHNLNAEEVKAYMLSTVHTYADSLPTLLERALDDGLEFTYGVRRMTVDKSRGKL